MARIHTRKNSKKFNDNAKVEETAQRSGIAVRTLKDYQSNGCDIYDDDAIREHIRKKGILPRQLNAEWYGGELPQASQDIQGLKDALLKTIDRNEASRIKTQIDGLLSAQKLEVLNASYISMLDVKEAFVKLGSVIRSGIMRMQADLPPALEGQSPSRMAKIIGESAEKLLTQLSETESELWQEE